MIGNDLELEIMGVFGSDLTSGYTILQISKVLNKAYPYINKKVNEFIAEGILAKTTVGKSYLCHLDLDNPQAVILLSLLELRKLEARKATDPAIEAVLGELKELREQFGITLAASIGNELVVVGHPSQAEQMAKSAPLLASKKLSVISPQELVARLARQSADQVFFGFEQYFHHFSKARGGRR